MQRIKRQKVERMEGRTNGPGRTNGRSNEWKVERMEGRTNGRSNEWKVERMEGRTNGRSNEWKVERIFFSFLYAFFLRYETSQRG